MAVANQVTVHPWAAICPVRQGDVGADTRDINQALPLAPPSRPFSK